MNSLNAQYNDLVLDYEQLRRENEDLKLKLKEKNELEEFELLEQKEERDQEVREIEILNLKHVCLKHHSHKTLISKVEVLLVLMCLCNLENLNKK